ncbi:hypothetical protein GCM10020216_088360 [Nonomuraea helvata]
MPQEISTSSRICGYPELPWLQRCRDKTLRFAAVSGTAIVVPSIAQTRHPRHHTPGVAIPAAGPRSSSHSHRTGSTPTRRRACTSALAVGTATFSPVSPAVSLCHTCRQPSSGNKHPASSRYTTTREGRSRTRVCVLPVCASASSTISNGMSRVSSPR